MIITLKCRKCRCLLLTHPETTLIDIHGDPLNSVSLNRVNDNLVCFDSKSMFVFYIQEVGVPQWVVQYINEENWLKGKLNCPGCSTRLGSFNFVSGFKCSCKKSVVPPIHIVRSKVDYTTQESDQIVNCN